VWTVRELTGRSQILPVLETDRLYAAYAIGDLEPGMFEGCTWFGAEQAGQVRALTLLYRGLTPPALVLMGDLDGLRALLDGDRFPQHVYLTCRPPHLDMTRDFYAWERTTPMWRMILPRGARTPVPSVAGNVLPLTPAHAGQLTQLFAHGGGLAFSPEQVARGVFYGVEVADRLVSVAGTHLVSPTYGVAAIGNVFTHPDYRGRGYATAATGAVVAELLRRGIDDLILNVAQDNAPAVRIYERLGFERYCLFYEGPAVRQEHRLGNL
jgi:RimJ/RimL family protein N-acetyltransferase